MSTTCTETLYIESATSLKDKIDRYNRIIEALETQMELVAAGNSDITSYSMDDGQVKISTQYRDPLSISKAILKFEQLKQKALNTLNGRNVALRPYRGMN